MGQLPNPGGFGVQPPAAYVQQYAALEAQREQLRQYWEEMREDVAKASTDAVDFKNQQLPLARIKKVGGGWWQGCWTPVEAAPPRRCHAAGYCNTASARARVSSSGRGAGALSP